MDVRKKYSNARNPVERIKWGGGTKPKEGHTKMPPNEHYFNAIRKGRGCRKKIQLEMQNSNINLGGGLQKNPTEKAKFDFKSERGDKLQQKFQLKR